MRFHGCYVAYLTLLHQNSCLPIAKPDMGIRLYLPKKTTTFGLYASGFFSTNFTIFIESFVFAGVEILVHVHRF